MIDCDEREKLRNEFEIAVIAALTENSKLQSLPLPSKAFPKQLERTFEADKREQAALTTYISHISSHRCLG